MLISSVLGPDANDGWLSDHGDLGSSGDGGTLMAGRDGDGGTDGISRDCMTGERCAKETSSSNIWALRTGNGGGGIDCLEGFAIGPARNDG